MPISNRPQFTGEFDGNGHDILWLAYWIGHSTTFAYCGHATAEETNASIATNLALDGFESGVMVSAETVSDVYSFLRDKN